MATSESRRTGKTTLRHVWLAGLGVAGLVRRVLSSSRRVGSILAENDDGIGPRLVPALRRLALRPRA